MAGLTEAELRQLDAARLRRIAHGIETGEIDRYEITEEVDVSRIVARWKDRGGVAPASAGG